jgi:hypothetical protein
LAPRKSAQPLGEPKKGHDGGKFDHGQQCQAPGREAWNKPSDGEEGDERPQHGAADSRAVLGAAHEIG